MSMTPEERVIWKKERRTGIGGSDNATLVGAIIGDDEIYGERLSVFMDKVGLSPEEDDEKNEAFYWGHALEPVVAARYIRNTNHKLIEPKNVIRHEKYKHFFASPDRLLKDDSDRGLEIKTVGNWTKSKGRWGKPGTLEVPAGPYAQVQWYMFCTGRPVWDIALLLNTNDYREYEIREDLEMHELLADIADEFWRNNVLANDPPPPGSVKMHELFLRRLYPETNHKFRAATADEVDRAYEYAGLTALETETKNRKEYLKNDFRESIGKYDGIIIPGGKEVTNKKNKSGSRTLRCGVKITLPERVTL